MLSSRAAFATLPPLSVPPPPVPQTPPVSTPLSTPSRPIPRSHYVNLSPRVRSPPPATPPASPAALEDVLGEREWVGAGLRLQGELIRAVPAPASSAPPPQEPAPWFEVVRKLGSGSYAVVYLVREVLAPAQPHPVPDIELAFGDDAELDVPQASPAAVVYGREFAVKCLSKANLNRDALAAQLFEATVHQSLPVHPNIVTLYRTLETDSFLLLLLECVPGEDLFYFLEQARDHADEQPALEPAVCPAVTPPTPSLLSSLHPAQLLSPNRLRLIASMFAQMCDAVASCHRVSVFHRDIKPENFIVTDGRVDAPDGRKERRVVVKLTDFGLATHEPESADMDCGSAPYMSYECRNNCAPTYSTRAADVWSLGIVLINMLYHHNPWSDTTAGACLSFEFFRADPVTFFMQRFTGMTREVAEFLATRVFCVLEDTPAGEAQRVSAEELGRWVKNLPAMLAPQSAAVPPPPAVRGHFNPVSTTPRSRRPSSRAVSIRGAVNGSADDATPVASSRPPSQRGMLLPLSTNIEGEFELAEPDLPEEEDDLDSCSRTTSTIKRRKRGARKGKGAQAVTANASSAAVNSNPNSTSAAAAVAAAYATATANAADLMPSSSGDLAQDLAVASQELAREISKTSKRSSKSPSRTASAVSTHGNGSLAPPAATGPVKKPSKWKDLLRMSSSDAIALNAPPPVPFPVPGPPAQWGGQKAQRGVHRDHAAHGAHENGHTPPSATAHNVSALIMSLSPASPASMPPSSAAPKSEKGKSDKSDKSAPKSALKSDKSSWRRKEPRDREQVQTNTSSSSSLPWRGRADVKNTLPVVSRVHHHGGQLERWDPSRNVSESEQFERWDPDRSSSQLSALSALSGVSALCEELDADAEKHERDSSPSSARRAEPQSQSQSQSQSQANSHSQSTSAGPWMNGGLGAGAGSGPGCGASSSNWRNSSSASSISGGTTASSAFTRFSNGSVRSVSTVATSVSAASSWRNVNAGVGVGAGAGAGGCSGGNGGHCAKDPDLGTFPGPGYSSLPGRKQKPLPPPPANLKIISGVPWELNELPRGCHVRPHEHVFAPPPLRYTLKQGRAAQQQAATLGLGAGVGGQYGPLHTISERAGAANPAAGASNSPTATPGAPREENANGNDAGVHVPKSPGPVGQRAEAHSSSSDIVGGDNSSTRDEGGSQSDAPKKVQKGQIHALAKMLSALKANRGAH